MNRKDFKTGDKLYSNTHDRWFTIFSIFAPGGPNDLHIGIEKEILHIGIKYSDVGIGKEYLTEGQYKVKRRDSIIKDLL